jgi:Matrixin
MKTIFLVVLVAGGCAPDITLAFAPPAAESAPLTATADAPAPAEMPSGIWIAADLDAAPILQGCAAWASLGVDCTVRDRPGLARIRVSNYPMDCPPPPAADSAPVAPTEVGLGLPDGTVALWGACLTDRMLLAHVAAHEIGHGYGLQHVQDDTAVMFWYSGATAPELTDSDRSEWNRVHP